MDSDISIDSIQLNLDKKKHFFDPERIFRHQMAIGKAEDYDVRQLPQMSDEQLGQVIGYFSAMLSFLTAETAGYSSSLAAVKALHGKQYAKVSFTIEKEYDDRRRPLKMSLEGLVYDRDPKLEEMKDIMTDLEAHYKLADGYREAWGILYNAASREITRRQSEIDKRR